MRLASRILVVAAVLVATTAALGGCFSSAPQQSTSPPGNVTNATPWDSAGAFKNSTNVTTNASALPGPG